MEGGQYILLATWVSEQRPKHTSTAASEVLHVHISIWWSVANNDAIQLKW